MTQPSAAVDIPRSACTAGSATATIVTSRTITNCARHGKATTIPRVCPTLLPSNTHMLETPTAATMRLDGGHPALELVNTIYAVLGGPVDFDVLATPDDLVTFARRLGAARDGAVPRHGALPAGRAAGGPRGATGRGGPGGRCAAGSTRSCAPASWPATPTRPGATRRCVARARR